MLALQGIHGTRHGQIGFTRTCRPDTEVDVVAQNLFDVALLIDAARANHALFGAQRHAGVGHGIAGQVFDGRFLQEQVHHVRRQLGGFGFAVQAAQQVFCRGGGFRVADQFELIAAIADFDGHALFDQT